MIFTPLIDFDEKDKIFDEPYEQNGPLTIGVNSNTYGKGASAYGRIKTDGSLITVQGMTNMQDDIVIVPAVYAFYVFYDGIDYLYMIKYIKDNHLPDYTTEEINVINNVGLTVSSGTKIKKPGSLGWDAGCASEQQINSSKGRIEFVVNVTDISNYQFICGLSHIDTDATAVTVEFGIYGNNGGVLYKVESGVPTLLSGWSFADGDLLSVCVDEVIPGSPVITYKKWNGLTWDVMNTSSNTPVYPLMFDCCLNKDGNSNEHDIEIDLIKISGYDLI